MAEHFRGSGHILRLIEFMDVGNDQRLAAGRRRAGGRDGGDDRRRLAARAGRSQLPRRGGQPLPLRDGGGEIGVIASVTQPFCRDCTRARLSAEGKLYTCLFANLGHDLRKPLREGATTPTWAADRRHLGPPRRSLLGAAQLPQTAAAPKVEMSHIGG